MTQQPWTLPVYDHGRTRLHADEFHAEDFRLARGRPRVDMDGSAGAAYAYALRTGSISTCAEVAGELELSVPALGEVLDRLVGLHLLRPDLTARNRFTPLDPDIAAAALISPLEGEIHDRRELITSIRAQVASLGPQYREAKPHRPEPVEPALRPLRGRTEVSGSLYLAASRCSEELISVRTRAAWPDCTLDEVLAQDVAMLQKGVRLRLVYPHSARTDFTTKAHLKRIMAEGAEVRTSNHLPRQFAVYDRSLAFTSDSRDAVEASSSTLASLLCDVFELVWDAAQPYCGAEPGYQGVADEILRDIAKLLAEGLTDEAISRRLGISLRACRRHIARLLRNLDAVSRFQAGTRAANVGIVTA